MMALSLWQPWATLIAIGSKQFETRSWKTSYRGPLVIHAAKRYKSQERQLSQSGAFGFCLKKAGYKPHLLPTGVFVAIVDLLDIVPTETIAPYLKWPEYVFGDYTAGRFAWRLGNIRPVNPPLAARGFQGLWKLDDPTIQAVRGNIQ